MTLITDLYPMIPTVGKSLSAANDNASHIAINVALYGRHSILNRSGTNRDSSVHQLDVSREEAIAAGHIPVCEYADEAVSGISLVNRPGAMQLLEDARSHRFEAVWFPDASRWGRNASVAIPAIEELDQLGIAFFVVGVGKVGKDQFMNMLITAEAGIRYQKRAASIKLGKLAEAGMSVTTLPFGYTKDKERKGAILKVPAELDIILEAQKRIRNGEAQLDVMRDLNRRGLCQRSGTPWNYVTFIGTVFRPGILRNALIAGKLVYGRHKSQIDPKTGKTKYTRRPVEEWKIGDVPDAAILSPAEFADLQSCFLRRDQPTRGPRHFLSGKMRCPACGSSMHSTGAGRDGQCYMACHSANSGTGCKNSTSFRRWLIEDLILDRVQTMLQDGSFQAKAEAEYKRRRKERAEFYAKDLGEAKQRLDRIDAKIAKIIALKLEGSMPKAWTTREMNALEADRVLASRYLADVALRSRALQNQTGSLDRVRAGLADVARTLSEGSSPSLSSSASDALAAMVDTITVTVKPGAYVVSITGFLTIDAIVPAPGALLQRRRRYSPRKRVKAAAAG